MDQVPLWATAAVLTVVAYLSLDVMGFAFWKSNKFDVEGKTVLLTGASQGMGKEIAKVLAQRGANVVLVARNISKLESAIEHVKVAAKNSSSQRFHYISADVTSEAENSRILNEATAWNNDRIPEVVWANAGSACPGLYIETSTETLRRQMDINYWAAAYLAHDTLRRWLYPDTPYENQQDPAKEDAPRHFIITSSAAAFVGLAGYMAYSPAKAGLRALADGLRHEVLLYNSARKSKNPSAAIPAPFDVNVHIVFPGTIDSPGLENENKTKHPVSFALEESDPVQSELAAATAAVEGLEKGQFMTTTSWLTNLLRFGMLGGSLKDNVLKDYLGQLAAAFVWLFAGPDQESKVTKWAIKEGMPKFRPNAQ